VYDKVEKAFAWANRIDWRQTFAVFTFASSWLLAVWAKVLVLRDDVIFTMFAKDVTDMATTSTRVGHNEV
jgi:hypothetical protein